MMKYVGMMILIWIMGMALHAIEPVKNIDPDSVWQNIGELKQQFGTDKAIPEEMQVAFYAAIAYYPMLSDVPVKVKQRDIKTTMQCRPRWDFFLRKKDKRHYKILVNNKVENNEGVLFEHLPFNARVGVFGHELAHVLDYSEKSNWQIIRFGVEYLNDENRRIIENRIDQLAIEQGLGYQIKDFSSYVFEESNASDAYLMYKLKYYFRPFQIRKIMAELPEYFLPEDVLVD
jgi:hypothetical protein